MMKSELGKEMAKDFSAAAMKQIAEAALTRIDILKAQIDRAETNTLEDFDKLQAMGEDLITFQDLRRTCEALLS